MARAQLFTHSEPTAVLALHGVTQEDAGTYRCRVDFKRSPTRYRKIALDVIGKFLYRVSHMDDNMELPCQLLDLKAI